MLALTQEEAGKKLRKSRRTIQEYETATPAKVDYCTRIVMQMLAQGTPLPSEWPEN